jgi:hypothetical protein
MVGRMAAPGADLRQRLAGPFVVLVALHSVAIGAALALFPRWSTAFGGFDPATAGFFTRQGGAFHLVLGAAYALEWRVSGTMRLMLLAKASATVFLLATLLGGGAPWAVALSAAGDAAMLVLALALRPAAPA